VIEAANVEHSIANYRVPLTADANHRVNVFVALEARVTASGDLEIANVEESAFFSPFDDVTGCFAPGATRAVAVFLSVIGG
jgi:hypothetical protein